MKVVFLTQKDCCFFASAVMPWGWEVNMWFLVTAVHLGFYGTWTCMGHVWYVRDIMYTYVYCILCDTWYLFCRMPVSLGPFCSRFKGGCLNLGISHTLTLIFKKQKINEKIIESKCCRLWFPVNSLTWLISQVLRTSGCGELELETKSKPQ